MKHYLITGGAGFVGSHLAELLLAAGHEVQVLDNLCTGNIHNIEHLKSHPNFRYVIGDLLDEPLLAEAVDSATHGIFHLAAAVGVQLIVEHPVNTIDTNIRGTELVLRMAAKKNRPTLIASTSEVYGKGVRSPFSEDDDVILGPTSKSRWSYACSKAIDEFLALSYWKERRQRVIVVRLFNTVGPRQVGHYGMVIPRFVGQALAGGPITVYGDGEQSRCFTDVADVVGGLARLMETEAAYGRVFNIGSTQEITINQLAEKVRELVGGDVAIEHISYDQAYEEGFEDIRRRVPDLTRIKSTIDYEPKHDIDSILKRVIKWYREERVA